MSSQRHLLPLKASQDQAIIEVHVNEPLLSSLAAIDSFDLFTSLSKLLLVAIQWFGRSNPDCTSEAKSSSWQTLDTLLRTTRPAS